MNQFESYLKNDGKCQSSKVHTAPDSKQKGGESKKCISENHDLIIIIKTTNPVI